MANLTKDEVNVLALRAYDIKQAEIKLYNESIENSEEYQEAIRSDNELLRIAKNYEKLELEYNTVAKQYSDRLEDLKKQARGQDPEEKYVNKWQKPDYEAIKSAIIHREVRPKFGFKDSHLGDKFMNKLKSVAVMNKAKSPTEVLEILLDVNTDE